MLKILPEHIALLAGVAAEHIRQGRFPIWPKARHNGERREPLRIGEEMVKLMVVQYSLSLAGFKKLIQSDEKWALPVSPSALTAVRVADEAEQAAKRALRNERKEKFPQRSQRKL